MKMIGLLCLALALVGCAAPSRYANDPRARCVGPAYLDFIDQHPPGHDTQDFFPVFAVTGTNYFEGLGPADPKIQALLTVRPEPTPEVKASTGQYWPKLEATGIPFDCGQP
jgi:hypothetical protein